MFATRSAVLSLAAGLLAIGGAQAADLPVKARAVEYVRVRPETSCRIAELSEHEAD